MQRQYATLLVVAVLGVLTLGTAGATSHLATDITADPAEANVSASHTVSVEVGEVANGSSLSGVEIVFERSFVENGGSIAAPGGSSDKVVRFGVDTDGDGVVDRGASGSVSTNGGDKRLLVQNTSGPGITAGSHIIVEYTGAMNPANGTYDANVTLNPQSASQTTMTTLEIGTASSGGDDGTDDGTNDGSDDGSDTEPTNPTLPGAEGPAQDLDGDGELEDADGDGDGDLFDAVTYYNARNSDAVQNNAAMFDFESSDPVGTLFDAVALFNDVDA